MAGLTGVIVTGDRKVALRFEQFPTQLHDRLLGRITTMKDVLQRDVTASAPERSGKLKSAIYGKVFDDRDRITGFVAVGEDFAKAGAQEWGARGNFRVRPHKMRLDHVFANRLASPLDVLVSDYRRAVDMPARRFLRDPIARNSAAFTAELLGTVEEATQQGEA